MDTQDLIKQQIEMLCKTAPDVHVSIKMPRPKLVVENAPARITGAYRNIFQLEENSRGRVERHSFQYGDVLIGHVVIHELDFTPSTDTQNKK